MCQPSTIELLISIIDHDQKSRTPLVSDLVYLFAQITSSYKTLHKLIVGSISLSNFKHVKKI